MKKPEGRRVWWKGHTIWE